MNIKLKVQGHNTHQFYYAYIWDCDSKKGKICRFNSLYYRDHTITINILYRTSTYRRYNYLRADLHLSNMMIDVDGSPTGYVAWYNYHTEASRIRPLRPALKNDKFGVQRMEMIDIFCFSRQLYSF